MAGLYLIAHIDGQALAINADEVDSVVDIAEIVPVPRTAPQICGIAALRSRIVTVIDAGLALGLASTASAARAVVLRVDGHSYALLVDALDDIAAFEPQPLANGLNLAPTWSPVARGMIVRDGEPVLIADLAGIVPALTAAA